MEHNGPIHNKKYFMFKIFIQSAFIFSYKCFFIMIGIFMLLDNDHKKEKDDFQWKLMIAVCTIDLITCFYEIVCVYKDYDITIRTWIRILFSLLSLSSVVMTIYLLVIFTINDKKIGLITQYFMIFHFFSCTNHITGLSYLVYQLHLLYAKIHNICTRNPRLIYEYEDNEELDQINQLEISPQYKSYVLLPTNSQTNIKENDQCSICLSKYSNNDKIIFLQCSHHYHLYCFITWVNFNNNCPYYRLII